MHYHALYEGKEGKGLPKIMCQTMTDIDTRRSSALNNKKSLSILKIEMTANQGGKHLYTM